MSKGLAAMLVLMLALATAPVMPAIAQTTATQPCSVPLPATVPDPDEALRDLPCNATAGADVREEQSDTAAYVLLGLVAVTVIGLAGFAGFLSATGLRPPWVTSLRHSSEEAGWRANGAWQDFRDWLRTTR